MKAWIYFARFGTDGPIKIGRACDPIGRVRGLMVGSPVALSVLGAALSDHAEEEEAEIHERLHAYCVRGEWFDAEAALREMSSLAGRLIAAEGLKALRAVGRRSNRRDHQLTIRIPQRIRDAIAVQADAERRSLADVLNNLFEELYPLAVERR